MDFVHMAGFHRMQLNLKSMACNGDILPNQCQYFIQKAAQLNTCQAVITICFYLKHFQAIWVANGLKVFRYCGTTILLDRDADLYFRETFFFFFFYIFLIVQNSWTNSGT